MPQLRCSDMGPLQVDPQDLLDVSQVAVILGLSNRQGVSAYRLARRPDGSLKYPDFPQPVINRGGGRCLLWLRAEIEEWRRQHPGRGIHKMRDGPEEQAYSDQTPDDRTEEEDP